MLRAPPVFGQSHADITLSEDGATATRGEREGDYDWHAAASTAVMRSGRHFAQFTVGALPSQEDGAYMMFGVH